ncbi:RimK family alpha-L-glutamate ligase [Haladaptatus sp. DYSN1]|uniref:RimK family alpha-L-glutamate ligase n=1 Tax=unclassified Haladaptatus TaxID=2622732 RepID=UPI002404EDD6|nr:RimK family alpha-L-glutamate ligase [Haladaptatus sp. DYSN1]
MTMPGHLRIGVLSLHSSKETKAILNAIDALGHDPEWLRRDNTEIRIQDGTATLSPDVDIVINRLLLSKADYTIEALCLADSIKGLKPVLNDPAKVLTSMHKYSTAVRLSEAGLPVPDQLLALNPGRLNELRSAFDDEAVYKTAIGTHGGWTWKVTPDEVLSPQVGNRWAFLQEFIEVDPDRHRDLRVYVVGDEVVAAMTRHAPEGDWRTNVALGGEIEDATDELTAEVRDIALRATNVVGVDYAGIDLVEGTDGWYVLEVNPTAGFKGLFRATGINPAPYIAALAIERAGGSVDRALVADLAAEFDDSTPSFVVEQAADSRSEERQIIGYTNEVTVYGTSGAKTVTAKSDTGATRTSIDISLAAEIGAGPITDRTRIVSGSNKKGKTRPVVDVTIEIGGRTHTLMASVEDRSHMTYPVIIGRDILKDYQVNVGA